MTGNPKAAWMRNALAIKDDDIWSRIKLGKDLQQGWGLTEGQQSRNVGEGGGAQPRELQRKNGQMECCPVTSRVIEIPV